METSRRSFLRGLFTVPVIVGVGPSVLLDARPPLPREPYVRVGDVVSYIGVRKYPASTFMGSLVVCMVSDWNGEFYPVWLWNRAWSINEGVNMFADHELVSLRDPVYVAQINMSSKSEMNWVRHKRFGEPLIT